MARNCPKAQEEQKKGENRSTPPASNLTTAPLKCIAPVAAVVTPPTDSPAETPATEATKAEMLLNIDFRNLVTEMVSCCGVEVRAVIDTGAGISIVSPALAEKLSSPKRLWDGETMVLANGIRTELTDAVEIEVCPRSGSHHGDGRN